MFPCLYLFLSLLWTAAVEIESKFAFRHHNYEDTKKLLNSIHKKCPTITHLYSLGKSVQERELLAMEITINPGKHEILKPEFKYVGNMHGNEVVGKEMLLKLLDFLCDEYRKKNEEIGWFLAETRVHIVPTMNPDGYEMAYNARNTDMTEEEGWTLGRVNANGVDLNRNFPNLDAIIFEDEMNRGPNNHVENYQKVLQSHKLQPETRAVIMWMKKVPFVLSINFHGGDLVANYPFDATKDGSSHEYSECPDDATFRELALSYSEAHGKMARKHPPCGIPGNEDFVGQKGITNGGQWYNVPGGMQDYNYLETNCFEITVELGCIKFPKDTDLPGLWKDNEKSLLNYMLQVHNGVKGVVKDGNGNPIPNAAIKIDNITGGSYEYIDHDVTSNIAGDYFRILINGPYRIAAVAPGYRKAYECLEVENKLFHTATELNFELISETEPAVDNFYKEKKCKQLLKKHQIDDEAVKQYPEERMMMEEEYEMEVLKKILQNYY